MKRFIKDLSGGLNLARPPHLIEDNQLSVATDCVYRSGKWQKRDGFANLTATSDSAKVLEITDQIRNDGTVRRFHATTNNIFEWNGSSYTARLAAGSNRLSTEKLFFTEINNEIYVTDSKNNIAKSTTGAFSNVSWDTSSSGRNVTAAHVILAFNSRLLLFNTTDGTDGEVPFRMLYTDVLDFDRVSNLNFLDLDYSGSPIVTAKRLGQNFIAVYKSDSIVTLQDQGSPLFFVPKARQTIGIIGPKAVTDIPNGHVFVSNDGIYVFNGANVEPIADRTVVSELFNNLNYTYKDNIYCWTDLKNREVIIHYPTGSSEEPDKCIVWNYQSNVWSQWNFNAYAGFYRYRTVAVPEVYFGSASGIVKQRDTSGTDGSSAIASTLATKAFHSVFGGTVLGASAEKATDYVQVLRVQTDATPASTLISVGTADLGTDSPSYTDQTITDTDGKAPRADFNNYGRYTTIKATNFTSLSEFVIDIESGGDS
tara:strand:- start:1076 stop:2521 length:1446 start_codon:yes stop_codon:yes gene_type:complete